MSYQPTKNIFKLMRLLSGERSYSIVEIEESLGIDERTIFRYLNVMEEMNYKCICEDGRYKQNKDKSDFSIINHSQKTTDLKIHFEKSKMDIKRIYNLLNDTTDVEPPMDFFEQFTKEYQNYFLN
jgi:hypothetical protein